MSEAKNHPPASSVTTLRILIIKKGEYDLWCMKMRQYIAITNHILWDIITNGDQATTEPASSSDRHLFEFHDAQDAGVVKATICWHVVATMIRGQPGLDELDFDDLYNNLKVTSRQSTADDKSEIITKGYAQASSSKFEKILSTLHSNSKACSKRHHGEIDWTKEFDDDPVTFAMVALNGIEEDDWSIEFDATMLDAWTNDWVDSDDEEVPLGFLEIKKQNVLKSETSSENKSTLDPNHLIKDYNLHERKLNQTLKPKPLETQGLRDSRYW
ncbi:hypothetical protein Tco_0861542 [Tanacetum coccineum]|uniref:DUF4219 domain-containing protein n=1 Tax=Tanacetum coccineum TaxID=301880 RepID=A0ABQ5BI48_9ASTR